MNATYAAPTAEVTHQELRDAHAAAYRLTPPKYETEFELSRVAVPNMSEPLRQLPFAVKLIVEQQDGEITDVRLESWET